MKLKRFFDFALSLIMLLMLSPFLMVIAIVVRVGLGKPIFFFQVRPGLGGRPFKIIKFRTMIEVSLDKNLLTDEERITKLGRFLRSTSLDELPELWNVLRGEMSLVGPRPLLQEYISLYSPTQAKRHDVRPGITGWAQINGRNNISWDTKLGLDVWYVENHTFMLDIKILAKTALIVLRGSNVNKAGHATTDYFNGRN